jgi:hypothetical protein
VGRISVLCSVVLIASLPQPSLQTHSFGRGECSLLHSFESRASRSSSCVFCRASEDKTFVGSWMRLVSILGAFVFAISCLLPEALQSVNLP